jgi:hypothetical protein
MLNAIGQDPTPMPLDLVPEMRVLNPTAMKISNVPVGIAV